MRYDWCRRSARINVFNINQDFQQSNKEFKMTKQIITLTLVASLFAIPMQAAFAGNYGKYAKAQPDIVQTAVSAGSFNTLVAALKAADLVATLQGEGPFTVFAPTDAAFAKLPEGTIENLLKPENKDQLTAILTYHVVPGKVMARDVIALNSAKTANGKSVAIDASSGGVRINQANVVQTDIETSNGVIHIIDEVILP
jgi:uncharacterized surface protein with fasciclin (FAS1) repeats